MWFIVGGGWPPEHPSMIFERNRRVESAVLTTPRRLGPPPLMSLGGFQTPFSPHTMDVVQRTLYFLGLLLAPVPPFLDQRIKKKGGRYVPSPPPPGPERQGSTQVRIRSIVA